MLTRRIPANGYRSIEPTALVVDVDEISDRDNEEEKDGGKRRDPLCVTFIDRPPQIFHSKSCQAANTRIPTPFLKKSRADQFHSNRYNRYSEQIKGPGNNSGAFRFSS